MHELNTKGLFAHEMYSLAKAFVRKLEVNPSQLESDILTHIPSAGMRPCYGHCMVVEALMMHPVWTHWPAVWSIPGTAL